MVKNNKTVSVLNEIKVQILYRKSEKELLQFEFVAHKAARCTKNQLRIKDLVFLALQWEKINTIKMLAATLERYHKITVTDK